MKKGHYDHIQAVFADRAIDERLENLREQSTHAGKNIIDKSSILDVCGDGADQAKFRLPRNFQMTKVWDSAWRPQLHVVGNMVSGALEAFYVTDLDIAKDANLACTCWARSLQLTSEILTKRNREMPTHMRFHTDNASSEGKNITVFCFAAWLVWNDAFESCDNTQFVVGHTHNRQDQRIGVACTGLARSTRLEDPHDVVACLDKAVIACRGRESHVEHFTGALDFKRWLESLNVTLSGHGSHLKWKEQNLESCHVWRFLKRRNLPTFADESASSAFQDPPHPDDIILRVKHRMASDGYAQPPQVFIPNSRFAQLVGTKPAMAQRSLFSSRQRTEFLKTAGLVEKEPWSMRKAKSYLSRLVHDNEAGTSTTWAPPVVDWVFSPHKLLPPADGVLSGLAQAGAATRPVWVTTGPAAKAAASKAKPAAAKSGTRPPKRTAPPVGDLAGAALADSDLLGGAAAGRPAAPPLSGAPPGNIEPGAPAGSGIPPQPRRRRIADLSQLPPLPEGVKLGCTKCVFRVTGCRQCRAKIGMREVDGVWQFV